MDTRKVCLWSIALFAWSLSAGKPLNGATVSATYSFIGSAHNLVIANGYITSDGVASGSVDSVSGVVFDTHNKVNLSTLQNYGTFTMIFPDGDTAFGKLHEDDTKVSLSTFSGPFTQILTFNGGTGQFESVSGTLSGGGLSIDVLYDFRRRKADRPGPYCQPGTWFGSLTSNRLGCRFSPGSSSATVNCPLGNGLGTGSLLSRNVASLLKLTVVGLACRL